MFAELKSRALLRVSGAEAEGFLQGLLSNDVSDLGTGARYTALLSPQGKILFDLILIGTADGFFLDCEAARAKELIAKLKLYRLRAKVDIARDDTRSVFVRYDWHMEPVSIRIGEHIRFHDPRLDRLGIRALGPASEIRAKLAEATEEAPELDFAAYRRSLGVAEGAGELGIEKLFLLEANAEELNGVDFQKGCYVGQELTSRMKRKTELKKRLLPLHVESDVVAGAPVTAGEEQLGNVIGGGAKIAFALLRLDRLADARAANAALHVGGAPATLLVPEFLEGKL